ncbi:MAG: ABC transporter ATP-binding protein, partial [Thermomicrobiales bacterium]
MVMVRENDTITPVAQQPVFTTNAIEVIELRRSYRKRKGWFRSGESVEAVRGISFAVPQGTIFGMLGPNGSGKTTTIKMLSTLLLPTSGVARIGGHDVVSNEMSVRRQLGVLFGGDRGLYNQLSARENLRYFGRLYGLDTQAIRRRSDEMLERVQLSDRADERVESFSRGMKQRLHVAKTLLHEPEVVILDEPSIGLDPGAQIELRQLISQLIPRYTVLLATHDMHEADVLCRELAILDRGEIVAMGSPAQLKNSIDAQRGIRLTLNETLLDADRQGAMVRLWDLPTVSRVVPSIDDAGTTVFTLRCEDSSVALDGALALLRPLGLSVRSIDIREPTLEDVFLQSTGRQFDADTAT